MCRHGHRSQPTPRRCGWLAPCYNAGCRIPSRTDGAALGDQSWSTWRWGGGRSSCSRKRRHCCWDRRQTASNVGRCSVANARTVAKASRCAPSSTQNYMMISVCSSSAASLCHSAPPPPALSSSSATRALPPPLSLFVKHPLTAPHPCAIVCAHSASAHPSVHPPDGKQQCLQLRCAPSGPLWGTASRSEQCSGQTTATSNAEGGRALQPRCSCLRQRMPDGRVRRSVQGWGPSHTRPTSKASCGTGTSFQARRSQRPSMANLWP